MKVVALALGAAAGFLVGYGFGALALDVEPNRVAKRVRQILGDPGQWQGA